MHFVYPAMICILYITILYMHFVYHYQLDLGCKLWPFFNSYSYYFNWFDDALSCMVLMTMCLFSLFMAVFCLMHHALFSLVTECISNILFFIDSVLFIGLWPCSLFTIQFTICSVFWDFLFMIIHHVSQCKEKKKVAKKEKNCFCRLIPKKRALLSIAPCRTFVFIQINVEFLS